MLILTNLFALFLNPLAPRTRNLVNSQSFYRHRHICSLHINKHLIAYLIVSEGMTKKQGPSNLKRSCVSTAT